VGDRCAAESPSTQRRPRCRGMLKRCASPRIEADVSVPGLRDFPLLTARSGTAFAGGKCVGPRANHGAGRAGLPGGGTGKNGTVKADKVRSTHDDPKPVLTLLRIPAPAPATELSRCVIEAAAATPPRTRHELRTTEARPSCRMCMTQRPRFCQRMPSPQRKMSVGHTAGVDIDKRFPRNAAKASRPTRIPKHIASLVWGKCGREPPRWRPARRTARRVASTDFGNRAGGLGGRRMTESSARRPGQGLVEMRSPAFNWAMKLFAAAVALPPAGEEAWPVLSNRRGSGGRRRGRIARVAARGIQRMPKPTNLLGGWRPTQGKGAGMGKVCLPADSKTATIRHCT